MQPISLEQWLSAYNEAEYLFGAIIKELQRVHNRKAVLNELWAIQNEFWRKLKEQGETHESLQEVSAFHGMIGSTISHQFFNPAKSKADLENDKSIINHFRNKLRELEST